MADERPASRALPWVIAILALCLAGPVLASANRAGPAMAKAPDPLQQVRYPAEGPRFVGNGVASTSVTLCLPIILNGWPSVLPSPVLDPIDNGDQDNRYTVSWAWPQDAEDVVLQEADDPSFSAVRVVFQGSSTSWTVPSPGKTPGTYYYRLKAQSSLGESAWSSPQQVTIHPIFVGLDLRWDGMGYLRGVDNYDIGTHMTRDFVQLMATDVISAHSLGWYDPNPVSWPATEWDSYFSVSTGVFLASSVPPDPSWKWQYQTLLPYAVEFYSGQQAVMDGQLFDVTGPFLGYTAFGQPVQYWRLVNSEEFVYWDGGEWEQRVYPGDITLCYDAGATRLLLMSNILRRYYYQDVLQADTVQYIQYLTSSNSFPPVGGLDDAATFRQDLVQ